MTASRGAPPTSCVRVPRPDVLSRNRGTLEISRSTPISCTRIRLLGHFRLSRSDKPAGQGTCPAVPYYVGDCRGTSHTHPRRTEP
jgi:hypothetical protein